MTNVVFSFAFSATGPEDKEGGDGGDDGDEDDEEYLEEKLEEPDTAMAYSSHCAPTFILLNILSQDLYCSTF